MSRRLTLAARAAAAGLMLALAAPAAAATCSVSPQGVSFGSYDTLSSTALDGVGNINVTCDALVTFTVSLSTGSGSYDERLMTGGGAQLGYNLYSDVTRLIVWGDGTTAGNVSASGTNVDLSVYGRIPALQNIPANAYTDSISVTVSY